MVESGCTGTENGTMPKETYKRFCNACGEQFTTTAWIEHFCDECRKDPCMGNIHRFCVCCGKGLSPMRQKYCSDECSIKNYARTDEQKYKLAQRLQGRGKKETPFRVIYECRCNATHKHKHHFDYQDPYTVILLCNSCHRLEHRRLSLLDKKTRTVRG